MSVRGAKIKELFVSQIYHTRIPNRIGQLNGDLLISRLKKEAYVFRELDDAGKKWSAKKYLGGYTSYSSLTDLHLRSPHFEMLKKWIDREVEKFARAQHWDLRKQRLSLTTLWINIMGHACHHSFHIHPLSVISGTFYVEVPRGAGAFTFEDPRLDALMAAPPLQENAPQKLLRHVKIQPKKGDLLLFESFMRHEVVANQGQGDRISISFNYGVE